MSTASVARPLRRIYLAGLVCAALAAAVGISIERARFGPDDPNEAMARVERSVRAEIDVVASALTDIAASVAREQALFDIAAADPTEGARRLLDRADQALQGRTAGVFAVTAYRPSGAWPLAWSGVPSEISLERIVGPETFFVARGPLGLRLIYTRPVLDPVSGHRVGVVAAERLISSSRGMRAAAPEEGLLSLPTLVPVTVRAYDARENAEGFAIPSPLGQPLLVARVTPGAIEDTRARWRANISGAVLGILALTLIVSLPPLLRWRESFPKLRSHLKAISVVVLLLVAARLLLWFAPTVRWTDQVFRTAALGPGLRTLLRTPVDFLLTMAVIAAAVMLAFDLVERLRRTIRHRLPPPEQRQDWTMFAVAQIGAGAAVALLLVGYEVLLGNAISATSVDALHFSLHPLVSARLAFALGLLLAQAVVFWSAVVIVVLMTLPWRVPRTGGVALAGFALQAVPVLAISIFPRAIGAAPSTVPAIPTAFAGLACLALAWGMVWARPRYRHASQALRLFAGALVLLIPAFVLYPSVHHFADRGLRRLIEEEYARQAKDQRPELHAKLRTVLQQIDALEIPPLAPPAPNQPASSLAFELWRQTNLATERLASSLELYDAAGRLDGRRFALNLPDYAPTTLWHEPSCDWEIFEEASLFGSEERRLFHAGRGICDSNSDVPTGGSIVVNVMLDYETLPFITARNPYNELIRPSDMLPPEGSVGRSVQFVVYGWGRGSLYSSNTRAFPLDDALLDVIAQSRRPFWTTMSDGERQFSTYIQNDRVGIYVIGFPVVTRLDHLINLAELTTLVGLTYAVLLLLGWSVSALGGTTASSGRALLREVRASFYRKLFLAFLAASVVPVMVLALATRTFFELQLESSVQSDAVRVASVAQRVIEEYVALQERAVGASPNDDIMVWLSRAIDQDVNIYQGPTLRATSERDLFDSGLLPERTPSHVYRAIEIDRLPSHVGQEVIGSVPHVLAAAPVRLEEGRAILTVPLALRQQEVDRQIDTLDRRVLLAAVLFALLGAAIGYTMAERIGDPVNRLTRATRRIARGDFSARVMETSSDELRRLVADFNHMAADLERQRNELQRTHRLEAWAEMARQVAHEIKNPLTPIQLSSEHLMRVNKDKGEPLTPVLEECVTSILSQVKLLRQISAEFSSFASRPTPHPSPTSLAELIPAVVEPYITGLAGRVTIDVDVPASLPTVVVDRVLLARALTNMIENALHAMPGGGTLTITATAGSSSIRLSVADTGTGMDPEALRRIFEPYFSTKATGTGLGLTIAKRNVELNGGQIHVQSSPGKGTTVIIELPVGQP
ncbi:MAG TPA: HAMP domain-containing sensor histidine kinase [Vicinamibacterales bacterium]|nr:HAMP domain-containing sensor histidine kinase [Vicinamibacterales bacterium]